MKKIILVFTILASFGAWADDDQDQEDVPTASSAPVSADNTRSSVQIYEMPTDLSNWRLDPGSNVREITVEQFVQEIEESNREAYWPDTSAGDREFGPRDRSRNSSVCRPGARPTSFKTDSRTITEIAGRPLSHFIRGDNGSTARGGKMVFCF